MREASSFTLSGAQTPAALPRGKALQLQCGSLQGLSGLLDPQQAAKIADVSALMQRAYRRFKGFSNIPMAEIIRAIHQYPQSDR